MENQYYISKEQFLTLKAKWKESNHHSAADMIIYNILRSKPADNGFAPKTKNIQGNNEWYAFNGALWTASRVNVKRIPGTYRMETDVEATNAEFKKKFGIDRPADLSEKFQGLKK
jgi:hypothetical protein